MEAYHRAAVTKDESFVGRGVGEMASQCKEMLIAMRTGLEVG